MYGNNISYNNINNNMFNLTNSMNIKNMKKNNMSKIKKAGLLNGSINTNNLTAASYYGNTYRFKNQKFRFLGIRG